MQKGTPIAQLVPERLPNRAIRSERQLSRALARLPADCLVYFELVVTSRYPNFIVIAPSLNVLTKELKCWRAEELVAFKPLVDPSSGLRPHAWQRPEGFFQCALTPSPVSSCAVARWR